MTRLAALLALFALAILFPLCLDLSGKTAIWFVFAGMPTLALALLVYAVARWRSGAFRLNETSRLP